jgi:hypothetical protein
MKKALMVTFVSLLGTTASAQDFEQACNRMTEKMIEKKVLCQIQENAQDRAADDVRINDTPANRQVWHDAAQEAMDCEERALSICKAYIKN